MSYQLIRGDALSLPLADESVDLIVTSPPSGEGQQEWCPYGGCKGEPTCTRGPLKPRQGSQVDNTGTGSLAPEKSGPGAAQTARDRGQHRLDRSRRGTR